MGSISVWITVYVLKKYSLESQVYLHPPLGKGLMNSFFVILRLLVLKQLIDSSTFTMKRHFLLVAIFFLLAVSAHAQFGIRAGFQTATTVNGGNRVQGSIPGWYLGAFTEDRLALKGGLKWHSGVEYVRVGHEQNSQNFRRVNYLAVPMGLKFTLLRKVYAQGGISPSFKVGEKYVVGGNDALNSNTRSSVFDLPMHIGAGVNLGRIDLDGRYNIGLISVNSGNRNRYFQLGGAFRF